ncbi:MAG: DUF2203 domain-containing protein [Candidatus Omnitrophica bacterium]|nr:DUF2203 domain-containing protein [Candidatus Omnitrophota bacterium]MDD5671670.1 DUF2203 domain-containing protein [Candidatus Omnitrophota bacterium]
MITMKTCPRLFTLEEANALLPELEERLSRILTKQEVQAQCHDFVLMEELLSQVEEPASPEVASSAMLERNIQELENSVGELEQDIEAIQEFGCLVRSVERGWVDFLGDLNGEKVYFCWKRGEKTIQYYHTCSSDVTERQPLF